MKKVILFLFVLFGSFFIAGCSKTQELECELVNANENIKMEIITNFIFKKDVITSISFGFDIEAMEEYDLQNFENSINSMDAAYEGFSNDDTIVYTSNYSEGVFTANFNIDYENITDEDLADLEVAGLDMPIEERALNIEDLKDNMEANDYFCIIK